MVRLILRKPLMLQSIGKTNVNFQEMYLDYDEYNPDGSLSAQDWITYASMFLHHYEVER